ncbi:hypothetical protein [Aestuariimicrobium ganziense]|uniref:hypothetical protein n=1 Tax=Aestuariimicrobium ganziense TaxID=2773677 RepID=UPI001943BABC|nr:hypothetical protein [Aestuariimicrobium ganziense]
MTAQPAPRRPARRWSYAPLPVAHAGRTMVIVLWVVTVLLVTFGIITLIAATSMSGPRAIVAWVVGLGFLGIALFSLDPLLTGGNKVLTVEVDETGLRAGNALFPDEVVLDWSQVAGLGQARKINPRPGVTTTLARSLEVLTDADIEVDESVAEWVAEPPPREGLTQNRLRFRGLTGARLDEVVTQVEQLRPDLWLGEIDRSWDPRPGH